jgi:RNA polymerase sigma-70 factor (ECF subfamily)
MSVPGDTAGGVGLRDDARFAHLYELHQQAIRDYCRRRLADHLVDDAVAETFLTAWRRIDDVPHGNDALLWLYRVAYRVIGHQWRSTGRRRRLNDKLRSTASRPETDAGEQLVENEEHRLVLEAAGHLGERDAEVLRLATWEQLPTNDIAALLDIAPNAVKQRIHRAKRNLAREYRRLDARRPTTPDAPRGGAR